MSYVQSTLVPGERIVCTAHYHWFYWAKRLIGCTFSLGIGLLIDHFLGAYVFTAIMGLLCVIDLVFAYLLYTLDEMVITTHRVVLKTGIYSRDVFEMQISKVETVLVDQSIPGRIFNYGDVACRGTGGTISKHIEIAAPLEFRAAFQNAVKESQASSIRTEVASAVSGINVSSRNSEADSDRLDEIVMLLREINRKLDSNRNY